MKSFFIEAAVSKVNPVKTVGAKGFQILPLELTYENNGWPQFFTVECKFDAVDQAGSLSVGDVVQLRCTIGGRKWTNDAGEDRIFTSVSCDEIRTLEAVQAAAEDAASSTTDSELPF